MSLDPVRPPPPAHPTQSFLTLSRALESISATGRVNSCRVIQVPLAPLVKRAPPPTAHFMVTEVGCVSKAHLLPEPKPHVPRGTAARNIHLCVVFRSLTRAFTGRRSMDNVDAERELREPLVVLPPATGRGSSAEGVPAVELPVGPPCGATDATLERANANALRTHVGTPPTSV